jgi:uncharacterized membrane protein
MANTTPYAVSLDAGTYKITVSKEGYETATRNVTLANGETKTETFTLTALKASLTVTSDPSGADVTVERV